ncbi:kinase-like domain-containing protein, partial [Mycena epipterygia]
LPDFTGLLVNEGRLHLLEVFGAGLYGVVYKALDTTSSPTSPTYYAVKCLGFGTDHDQRGISLHTACSSHPSIITFHRQFYTHGCLCNGVFENNNVLIKEVFPQLVDAVCFCHQRGVHHRDLKPENILYSADGTNVRIADFGFAVDDELPCSTAAGTICYISPGTSLLL